MEWAGVFKGAQRPLGEGVAENGVVELVETTPVGARGRLSPPLSKISLLEIEAFTVVK